MDLQNFRSNKHCLEEGEVISSEELISYVDDLNNLLKEEGTPEEGLCIGSLDVKALYPSLVIKMCSKIAHDRLLRSKLRFDGGDIKWACIYLALNLMTYEVVRAGLQMYVPSKANKGGKDPSVLTTNAD